MDGQKLSSMTIPCVMKTEDIVSGLTGITCIMLRGSMSVGWKKESFMIARIM